MEAKYKIISVWVAVAILVYLVGSVFVPEQQKIVFFVSSFGFLALLDLAFVLLIPSIVRWKNTALTRFLLVNRRWVGLSAFFFALTHIIFVYNFFFAWNFLAPFATPRGLFMMLGGITFLILTLMAATSNDFSVRTLGRNWKKLHLLVYLAFALILIHGFNLGLVYFRELFVQIVVAVIVIAIVLLKTGIVKFGP